MQLADDGALVTVRRYCCKAGRMNDDDPREVLALLKAEHRRLDQEIELLALAGNCDQLELARMKKRKLTLKDEIQDLANRIIPDIIA